MSDYEWRRAAKCLGEDTELWFPPRKREMYRSIADISKAVCRGLDGRPTCVVISDCLLYALEMDEQHGIWGGMSHRERNHLMRQYNRKGGTASMTIKDFLENGPPA